MLWSTGWAFTVRDPSAGIIHIKGISKLNFVMIETFGLEGKNKFVGASC